MATRKVKIRINGRKYLVTGLSREILQKDFLCSLAEEEKQLNGRKYLKNKKTCGEEIDQKKRACNELVLSREKEIKATGNRGHSQTSLAEAGIEFGIFYVNNVRCEKENFDYKGIILRKRNKLKPERKLRDTNHNKQRQKKAAKGKNKPGQKYKVKEIEIKSDSQECYSKVEFYEESKLEETSEDFLSKEDMCTADKKKLSFGCSKEEWIEEIRKKSPMYALKDENQNYIEFKKGERSDSEADNDSGIPSIDGDTPQEKILTRNLIEEELFLSRQDSGVSSEGTENSVLTSQSYCEAIATDNKRLPCKDFGKQVILSAVVIKGGRESKETHLLQNNYDEIRKFGCQNEKERFADQKHISCSSKKRNSFGKECSLREKSSDDLTRINGLAGGLDSNYSILDKHLMSENNKIGHCLQDSQLSSIKGTEKIEVHHSNLCYQNDDAKVEVRKYNEYNDVRRNSKDSGYSDKDVAKNSEGTWPAGKKVNERAMIWKEYNEMTKSLSDTLDQLLFKDLMRANLTADILNFSDENYSIEDEMNDLEEKYLQHELFDTHSLLQTFELISEKQCLEKHFIEQHIERTQREIEDKRLILQALERLYRSNKFKTMPKQLKRYCSTESLMNDVDNCEKHEHLEVVLDVEETFQEEISLV